MASDSPLPELTAAHVPDPLSLGTAYAVGPGSRIGPYKILDQLGEGGMGTVYLAEQQEPVRRRVALKLIKPGMDSAQVVARFEAERQALARMDHPNIAMVLDAGTTEHGRPYFVMELVRGVPITKYCDDARLTVRERLELFVSVCKAVQHAHTKGIIHRDIKPSNVLVTLSDGKPVPKVIDFGVAKAVEQSLTERTMFTQIGAVVGTWEYMSPEQADASPLGVDTRSDVYSLGVLLYELITGATPLQRQKLREGGFSEIIRHIREIEPPRPSDRLSALDVPAAVATARRVEPTSRLARLVRGDLDWVVMKALAKRRAERYETANDLARDVRRYLADEPVDAHPPSALHRVSRFMRRNRVSLVVAFAFVSLLVAGAAVSAWQAVVAKSERNRALATREQLRSTLTRRVADGMQSDLERLTAVGTALGNTVEHGEEWDEARIAGWMRRMLDSDPKILGLCIAFEPGTFEPPLDPATDRKPFAAVIPFGFDEKESIRDGYSLYVSRDPKDYKISASALWREYRYRTRFWYTDSLAGRAGWTEPNFDLYAVGMPMVSHTAPIRRRDGRAIGVLTIDLSLDYFKRLESDLKNLNLGEDSYGFVLSATGRIVSHPHLGPNPLNRKIGELSPYLQEVDQYQTLRELLATITSHSQYDDIGQVTGIDPATRRQSRFLYAKFKPAGWIFVAVIPEEGR